MKKYLLKVIGAKMKLEIKLLGEINI